MCRNAYTAYSLDDSSLAYDLFHMLGYNFTINHKDSSLQFLLSRHDPKTGLFHEVDDEHKISDLNEVRSREMSANYITFQVIGALKIFEALPLHKISFYDQYIENKGIVHYLVNNCPWDSSPWGAGGMVDNLGTILDCNIRMGFNEYQTVLDDVLKWVYENQSEDSGMWGNPEAQGQTGLVNGAYHLLRGTLFLQKKPVRYCEKIIDAILYNINHNNHFKEYAHACYDLDHFFLLQKCNEIKMNYRRNEVVASAEHRMQKIQTLVQCDDGAFSFESSGSLKNHAWLDVSPGIKESDLLGTVFYLQVIISIQKNLNITMEINESKTHG